MGFISRVRVIRSLVFCVVFCRSLFVLFLFVIMLSVIPRFTDSDYPFGIFKLLSYPFNGHQRQPQNRGDYIKFIRDQECWPFNGFPTTATEETRGPPMTTHKNILQVYYVQGSWDFQHKRRLFTFILKGQLRISLDRTTWERPSRKEHTRFNFYTQWNGATIFLSWKFKLIAI